MLALAMLVYSPLYCAAFDRADRRLTGRLASDRPNGLRLVHALGHELGAMLVSVPVLLALTDLGLGGALALDLGLSLAYAGWTWVFFVLWDRLRPQPRGPARRPVAIRGGAP